MPAVNLHTAHPGGKELALAIGSPLGFENTVTQGIVSGVNRRIPGGALVRDATAVGPAATAGVKPGDVIVKFNDILVQSVEDLDAALRHVKPGDTARVGVDRRGPAQTLTVTLGTLSRKQIVVRPTTPTVRGAGS